MRHDAGGDAEQKYMNKNINDEITKLGNLLRNVQMLYNNCV